MISATDGGDCETPLTSILEMNTLDDFLANAVMQNREFVAEKERIVLMSMDSQPTAVLDPKEQFALEFGVEYKAMRVPRRPD